MLFTLGMIEGRPNGVGGVNLRRLDRGDGESGMLVAGIEGISSDEKAIMMYERQV